MEGNIEKQVINLFKNVLYRSLFHIRDFNFVLAGTGALQFHAEDIDMVTTLDADIHFWLKGPIDGFWNWLQKYLYDFFVQTIKQYYSGTVDYYLSNISTDKPWSYGYVMSYKHRNRVILDVGFLKSRITVLRIRILGFDLADISEHEHKENDYMVIPVRIDQLKVLTPYWFFQNHLEIIQEYSSFININAVINLYDNNKQLLYFIGQTYKRYGYDKLKLPISIRDYVFLTFERYSVNSEYLRQWACLLVFLVLFFNATQDSLRSKLIFEDTLNGNQLNKYADNFGKFIMANIYIRDINQFIKRRLWKTLKRLYIFMYLFIVDLSINIQIGYRPHRSSCMTLKLNKDNNFWIDSLLNQQRDCNKRIVMGYGSPMTPDNHQKLEEYLLSQVKIINNISCKDRFGLLTKSKKYDQITLPFFSNDITQEDAFCLWSQGLGTLSNLLRDYYISQKIGTSINWKRANNYKALLFFLKLEEAATAVKFDEDITVYKTTTHILYSNKTTADDLKVGQRYQLLAFNSTSYNQSYNGFIEFSDPITGIAGYEITIPRGTAVGFMGRLPSRTYYTNQSEILLPPGGYFDVKNSYYSYIGYKDHQGRIYNYRMKIYKVTYIPSPNYIRNIYNQVQNPKLARSRLRDDDSNELYINEPNFILSASKLPFSIFDWLLTYFKETFINSLQSMSTLSWSEILSSLKTLIFKLMYWLIIVLGMSLDYIQTTIFPLIQSALSSLFQYTWKFIWSGLKAFILLIARVFTIIGEANLSISELLKRLSKYF